jgi:3-methyladenine DNA glycosylase Tag
MGAVIFMISFEEIYGRAAARKGGEAALKSLLPEVPDDDALRAIADDRMLAEMTKCIFRAGFVWRVIEQKWPAFEQAFLNFAPQRLAFEPDEYWEKLCADKSIVRNAAKIMSVRHNAGFVLETSKRHDGFGAFLADWPRDNLVGLWDYLAKHGKRLGGMTGRYFLRFIGKDSFLPSHDVVRALRDGGLEIAEQPTSKRDLKLIQDRFNQWSAETGMSLTHLSRILAMSIGENLDPDTLNQRGNMAEED